MARFKTFVATGIATDGRLYAGDLNGIQDSFVSLSDFSQVLDVGTLRVGDTSLQLLKYGAGEFRMSGSLRIDGILRALGGMLAGAFTTTQRDAIIAGSRPFTLIIFNTTTVRYEYNAGTDATPNWQPLGGGAPTLHAATHLPGGSDALTFTSINLVGLRSVKPAASANNNGLFYFETDWNVIWRSNGTLWVRVAHWPRKCTLVQFAALPDYADDDEVILEIDATLGIYWNLRYNAASGSVYKWEVVGSGTPLFAENTGNDIVSSTSYNDIASTGPSIAIPRPGDYLVEISMRPTIPATWNAVNGSRYWMSYAIGGTGASDNDACSAGLVPGMADAGNASRIRKKTGLTAVTLTSKYRKDSGSTNGHIECRWMKVIPLRIS